MGDTYDISVKQSNDFFFLIIILKSLNHYLFYFASFPTLSFILHLLYYSKNNTFTPCPMDRVALAGGTTKSMAAQSSHSMTRTLTRTITTTLHIQTSAHPPHGIPALNTTPKTAFLNSTKSTSTRTICLPSVRLSRMPPPAKPRQSLSLLSPTLSPSSKHPRNAAPSTTGRPSAITDTATLFSESR